MPCAKNVKLLKMLSIGFLLINTSQVFSQEKRSNADAESINVSTTQKINLIKYREEKLCKGIRGVLRKGIKGIEDRHFNLAGWVDSDVKYYRPDVGITSFNYLGAKIIYRDIDSDSENELLIKHRSTKRGNEYHSISIIKKKDVENAEYLDLSDINQGITLSYFENPKLNGWANQDLFSIYSWLDVIDFDGKIYILLFPNDYDFIRHKSELEIKSKRKFKVFSLEIDGEFKVKNIINQCYFEMNY